jgi:hypothetical protein
MQPWSTFNAAACRVIFKGYSLSERYLQEQGVSPQGTDWFQGSAKNDTLADALQLLTTAGDTIGNTVGYYSRKARIPLSHEFHKLARARAYSTQYGGLS